MIVDVHTHVPFQVKPVPDDEARYSLRDFNLFATKHHLPEVPGEALEAIVQRDSL